jgi:guanylate kinase
MLELKTSKRQLLSGAQRVQLRALPTGDLENIERRASSAYIELKEAWHFNYVITSHDGEDSENWDAFYYLVGDARKTLLTFADLVGGKAPPLAGDFQKEISHVPRNDAWSRQSGSNR